MGSSHLLQHGEADSVTVTSTTVRNPRGGPITPAASTRKRGGDVVAGPDVFIRDASHYATGSEEAGQ